MSPPDYFEPTTTSGNPYSNPHPSTEHANSVQDAVANLARLIISHDGSASVAINGDTYCLNFSTAPKSAYSVPNLNMQSTVGSFMLNDPMAMPEGLYAHSRPSDIPFHAPQQNSDATSFSRNAGAPFGSQQSAPFTPSPGRPSFQGRFSDCQGPPQPRFISTLGPQSWQQSAQYNRSGGESSNNLSTGPSGMFGPGAPNVITHTYDPDGPVNQNASSISSMSSNAGHAGSWNQQPSSSFQSADSQQPHNMCSDSYGRLRGTVRDACLWAGLSREDIVEERIPDSYMRGCRCDDCLKAVVGGTVIDLLGVVPGMDTAIHR